MPHASLRDIRDYRFPADVQQCGECAALVLKSNASFHAGWHEILAAETNRKIAEAIAERRATARSVRRQPAGPPQWLGS